MIHVENVSKMFGPQVLYRGASFSISPGVKVALLGPNGAGKTTLFKILCGEELPDEGEIHTPKNFRWGVLRQEWIPGENQSILDSALAECHEWNEAYQKVIKLKDELSSNDSAVLKEYQEWEERFLAFGGYEVIQRTKEVLSGLGFSTEQFDTPCKELSGGWRIRVHLAGLLAAQPDALLLDEPTNHLDIESVEWFESFLKYYPSTVLLITHDRRLAERLCDEVLEFTPPQLNRWPHGVKRFEREKVGRIEILKSEIANKEKELARMQDFVRRFRAKASKARQAQSRLKSSEGFAEEIQLLKANMPIISKRPSRFSLKLRTRLPKLVAEFKNSVFGYQKENPLFSIETCQIEGGKKIGVIGSNGVGKSTFLKTLAGELSLLEGEQKSSINVSIGHFAQHRMEELPLSFTALDYLTETSEGNTITEIRSVCGSLGLNQNDVEKKMKVLSGGEKARVSLSKILLSRPSMLLLDEPTNHLDLEACDALVKGLKDYEGTVLVVSHNREFLDSLSEMILDIQPGEAFFHYGNYTEWLDRKNAALIPASSEKLIKDKPKKSGKKSKEQKRLEAEERKRKSDAKKKAGGDGPGLEQSIEESKKHLEELDAFLCKPESAQSDEFAEKLKDRNLTQAKIERLEEQYLQFLEESE